MLVPRVAPPRVLSLKTCIPARRTVPKPGYFRASLGRYPQRCILRTQEAGLAWIDLIPKDRVECHGTHTFPVVADGYQAPGRKEKLAGTAGFEPATSPLTAERSTSELHAKSGGGGRSRTFKARRAAGLQPA